jgi:DNA adenine methylase
MYYTPLRYPGGKGKLANFLMLLVQQNRLTNLHYVEPYAGGAAVALALLFHEYAAHIYINDISIPIYAFWHAVLNETDELCRRIRNTEVNVEEWYRQKEVFKRSDQESLLDLGFATFFLNRTSRSGILNGGIIGGKKQTGPWKLDARFNKEDLIRRITKVAQFRSRIHISKEDAATLIRQVVPNLPAQTLVYLDPPYYVKGQDLYDNFYHHDNHAEIASLVASIPQYWLVSYDDVLQINKLYDAYQKRTYSLNYSAATRQKGTEVMIFCERLVIPKATDPVRVDKKALSNQQSLFPL